MPLLLVGDERCTRVGTFRRCRSVVSAARGVVLDGCVDERGETAYLMIMVYLALLQIQMVH
jgi:hypothetical protein|eukprot:scaffold13323_cov207-Alexandrium_tamarense.AAC.21